LRSKAWGAMFGVPGLQFRVRVWGLEYGVRGLGFGILGIMFGVRVYLIGFDTGGMEGLRFGA
jgi:hypothetical protein